MVENKTNIKEIEIWKKKLLDLGKKNSLINFRDTKSSTLEIVYPNFDIAFKKIAVSSSVQVFDDKTEDYDFYDNDEENKLSKREYIDKYSKKVSASQVLLFNAYKPVKTILRNLMKKALDSINERGVNILYAVFGFIEWFDSDNTKFRYKAPILMVPLVVTNESINSPIYLNQFDEDISINPTLKYMLENQYGITLPEFDEQDIDAYMDEIEELISKQKWSVQRVAKISTFSFNKLSMYLDLENNANKIMTNQNVKLLTNAEIFNSEVTFSKEEFNELNKSRDLFAKQNNVVDADFSQTEAIEYAMMGKSFVLQGPPGTGKSQTITNMIAELIYAGKKVLFVSEKMAALEVVHKNLRKAKLSDYCLQLHSYKANKRDFLDDLYTTLFKSKITVDGKVNNNFSELLDIETRLNNYNERLYKVYRPIDMSLHQLIGIANHLDNLEPIPYVISDISSLDNKTIIKNSLLLKRYCSYEQSIGYNYKNFSLYGLIVHDSSFVFKLELENILKELIEAKLEFLKLLEDSNNIFKINISENNILQFVEFIKFVVENNLAENALYNIDLLNIVLKEIDVLNLLSEKIKKYKFTIDSKYNAGIYKENPKKLYDLFKAEGSSFFKRLFNKKYKEIIKKIISLRKNQSKVKRSEILSDLKMLIEYSDDTYTYNSNKTITDYGFTQYNGYDTDWTSFKSTIIKLKEFLLKNPEFKETIINVEYVADYTNLVYKIISKHKSSVESALNYFDKEVINLHNVDEETINKLESYKDALPKLDLWVEYFRLHLELQEANLTKFINLFVEKNRPLSELEDTYKLVCYKQWIDYIFKNDNWLREYNRFLHESDVRAFCDKDKVQLDISKAKINEKLSNKRPDPMLTFPGTPVGILMHEHEKKRKLKPIRLLMKEIPDFIQTLKPCFLMSPLSVSTFLSDNIQFDVTIFDEASQVFPEDAIVAIYRSKQLIVVGDSRQMPPSKFFMTTDYDDDEYNEETSDIDSYESILDLCSTTFPTKALLCHYRSRDESLITFSNKHFYNFNLLTYPSVHEKQDGLGIDFTFVPNGIMDSRSKVNIKEAEKVVDMIFEHFKRYPNRSLGVVAFNIKQQDAILKMLDKRRSDDPSMEEFFKADKEEPFFIKNLETVQGDERDTIIFSVTYAKNDKGQFALRFGPLNLVGGERRLNVAVTRAKLNIKVVSSIKAIDIDVSRVSNEGPKLLHDYLDYAEHGTTALDKAISLYENSDFDSPFEQDVYQFLKDEGFDVTTQVGCSKYRIDLALKRTNTSDYVLAIECDGAAYHSSKSARDRDRLRQSTLERMGWKFYRIWSTDWYKNNATEKKALIEACKKALDDSNVGFNGFNDDSNLTNISQLVGKIPAKGSVNLYTSYNSFRGSFSSYDNVTDFIDAIVKIETPISIDYLLKKISYIWGSKRVTTVIKKCFERHYRSTKTIRENGFLYMNNSKQYKMRNNITLMIDDINFVSEYELRNGMYQAIEYFGTFKKDDLFAFIRHQLGFSRTGDKITSRLEKAFSILRPYILVTAEGNIKINSNNKLILLERT